MSNINMSITCEKWLKSRAIFAMGTVIMLGASAASHAATIYGESASLTGTRTVDAVGLTTNEGDWSDAEISWTITDNLNGTYNYLYTFENFNSPVISHVTLDLTDAAILGGTAGDNPGLVSDFRINGVLISDTKLEFGDKDGIIGAVKFDENDPETIEDLVTYSFNSNRQPVWGHIFIKGGSGSTMTNTGFGDQSLSDAGHYIARPDGVLAAIAPEPSSLTLVGLGMATAMAMARRARSRRTL
jgi:hypothetical protein